MGRGRLPCCEKSKVKQGPWSPAEDSRLITFIHKHGHSNWRALPKQAGLLRCGKSCRLRWINYLRPDVKRGNFTKEEEETIIKLHQSLGNKWSKIASHLPGRTDNEIKNVWNTHLKKRVLAKKDDNFCEDEIKELSKTSSSSTISEKKQEIQTREASSSSSISSNYMGVVNSDEQVIEIDPLEADIDFWDNLDNLDPFKFGKSQPQDDDDDDREFEEYRKWLRSLENELGLEATSDGDHISPTSNSQLWPWDLTS